MRINCKLKNVDAAAVYAVDIHRSTLRTTFKYLLLACNAHPASDENTEQDRQCMGNVSLRRVPATIVGVEKL